MIRQFLTESIVLALVGGLAGLLVASWFAALLENHYPVPLDVHIDRQTAAFNTLLGVVAGFAFGLVPALRTSRLRPVRIQEAMASPSITRSLLWSAFVVLQIGLSVVLVAGAALLIQSRAALMAAPGFDASNVIYLQMKPHLSGTMPSRREPTSPRSSGASRRSPAFNRSRLRSDRRCEVRSFQRFQCRCPVTKAPRPSVLSG